MWIACAALRTNLTMRELAASFAISKSAAHRIVSTMIRWLAALSTQNLARDRWYADPDSRPSTGCPFEEQPRVLQRADGHPPTRSADLRHHHGWSRQPQRPVYDRGSHIDILCKQHGRTLADSGHRGVPELITPVFRGNRLPRDRAWRRHRRRRARVEHAIARLKNWRILRDHRRRGCHLANTLQKIVVLHNLHLDELRDNL
jgi:hypothetical protein